MNVSSILLPVIVQVGLTLTMYLVLIKRKLTAMKAGAVDEKKAALDHNAWPDDVLQVSNNIANQFQLPVLFYTLALLFYTSGSVGPLVLGLAWVFAGSRILHALVHITSNRVPVRFSLFAVGVFCVVAMVVLALMGTVPR